MANNAVPTTADRGVQSRNTALSKRYATLANPQISSTLKIESGLAPEEREADNVATQVLASKPFIKPLSKNVSTHANDGYGAPASVTATLAGNGEPMGHADRAYFEPRFGYDFGKVRIHRNFQAHKSAQEISALAYTAGNHIVFSNGRYAPGTGTGRGLLAHELTHVIQQQQSSRIQRSTDPENSTNYRFDTARITANDLTDPEIIRRLGLLTRQQLREYRLRVLDQVVKDHISQMLRLEPTSKVETNSALLARADIEKNAGVSYWEQRTLAAFDTTATARIINNAEERDAVYSSFWQAFPNGSATPPTTKQIAIPSNRQRGNALLYEFTIRAPINPGDKPRLRILFKHESPGDIADTAQKPPKGYIARPLEFQSDVGFADSADKYFATHRQERRQVSFWLKQQDGEFDKLLVTKGAPTPGGGRAPETLFRIKGMKRKGGGIDYMDIELLGGGRPQEIAPVADYQNRDYADFLLEQQKTQPNSKLGDTLGDVDLSGVPADELFSVKYAILRYFRDLGTRDAEADVLVPIAGNANKEVFYSLRFHKPNNDVDVQRIGVKGSTAKLDPTRMDIARARNYSTHASSPDSLKSWLRKRYPSITLSGTTVEEIRSSANQVMSREAGSPQWFQTNYKLPVMGANATQKRLRSTHGLSRKQTPDADKRDFTKDQLDLVELSLQTLSEKILSLLEYTRLGRSAVSRDKTGAEEPYSGMTYQKSSGTNRSIVLFDKGFSQTQSSYRGGSGGVNLTTAMLVTHEAGHAVERRTNAKNAFNRFVKSANIQPFTDYADTAPERESFTEAFALYQTDPEWLLQNHSSVYWWMETFNRTGKPPK